MFLEVQISWQVQHFVNLHVQISWQVQHFVYLHVQISWQAQHFVNLHVQISWQVQHFVNLHVQISWQVQHFVNLHAQISRQVQHFVNPCADFVAGAIQNALWRDGEGTKCCIFQWNRWLRSWQVKVCGTTVARRCRVMLGSFSGMVGIVRPLGLEFSLVS